MISTTEISLIKFGQVFSSRPEGREAALATVAYHLDKASHESVTLDFENVLIMTPSWLSEFIQTLKQYGVKKISFKNDTNQSVKASIAMVDEENLVSGS